MILQHVAQGAGLVVIAATSSDAERFGRGDLNMVDPAGIPQRLQQRVREPRDEQVLHAFLAEVVVDPEDLPLLEHGANRVVDGLCGRQVVPDRLLQHNPRVGGDQALTAEGSADRPEQRRRARQVEDPDVDGRRRKDVGDGRVVGGLGQVDADEPQPCQEAVDGGGVE